MYNCPLKAFIYTTMMLVLVCDKVMPEPDRQCCSGLQVTSLQLLCPV
jgi:hypothetical protein